jgi:uncharacterized coiled-coil protein SlyX
MANTLTKTTLSGPEGNSVTCAQITIDTVTDPLTLPSLCSAPATYVFTAWIKSSVVSTVTIEYIKKTIPADAWAEISIVFDKTPDDSKDLEIYFNNSGTFYLYNSQLERGYKPTKYQPNPDDIADTTTAMQTQIEHNDNAIAETTTGIAKNAEDVQELYSQMNATNADLTDVITVQSAFSQTVDGLNASVTRLQGDVNNNAAALKPVTEWMRFDETGMAIGNSDSGRKVKINEQAVEFDNAAGEAVARFAEKAEIHDLEIADGGTFSMGNWAWIPRSNGNLSLKWIGGH